MSSKNLNKKSDDKNDKAEKEALKEVEIIAELAPNEKTRKEAEKLIETVENGSTTIQEQEQEAIETVLDETKRAIKKTVSEAKSEIPGVLPKAIGRTARRKLSKQPPRKSDIEVIELQESIRSPKFRKDSCPFMCLGLIQSTQNTILKWWTIT